MKFFKRLFNKIYYKIRYIKNRQKYRLDIIDKLDNNKVISSRIIFFGELYSYLDLLPKNVVGVYIERIK